MTNSNTTCAMNRRQFNRLLGAAGLGLVMTPMMGSQAKAAEQSVFLTWGGYEDPSLHGQYIAQHGTSPEFSLSGDEDEMFQKVRAGFSADLAHPTTANTQRWIDAGLAQPIDTTRLTEWDNLFPALVNQPGVKSNGEVISVPFDWGRTSIIYRTDKIQLEEESWGILWDKKYAGRIAVLGGIDDLVPITAAYIGVDPYNMSSDEEAKVLEMIERQKPLLRFYSDDMTTLQQALASGELWAAVAWDEAAINLKSNGVPVKFMQPKEGVLTWLGGIVLLKGANEDKAYDLLNAMLDPASGKFLIEAYGYGHSNARSYTMVSDDALASLQLPRDPSEYLEQSSFLKTIPNKSALALRIAEIKAAP